MVSSISCFQERACGSGLFSNPPHKAESIAQLLSNNQNPCCEVTKSSHISKQAQKTTILRKYAIKLLRGKYFEGWRKLINGRFYFKSDG
jgi:hypothetical protein